MEVYLMSQEPISRRNPDPETPMWLARWMIVGWNKMADLCIRGPSLHHAEYWP